MKNKFTIPFIAGIAVAVMLIVIIPKLYDTKVEAKTSNSKSNWSPTKPYPEREVYFPGTEELAPDEMRVIACGSGMPMPRLKQAAAS